MTGLGGRVVTDLPRSIAVTGGGMRRRRHCAEGGIWRGENMES